MSTAKNIGLFGENVGLFRENIGLFWEMCAYWRALVSTANQWSTPVKWHKYPEQMAKAFIWHASFIYLRLDSFISDMTISLATSCHIWMSHVTYGWVMSHMNESCHVWMSHVKYGWVMSRMNESCHVWISHVTYGWVMSRLNESCHVWISHVTYGWVIWHINEPCHIWIRPERWRRLPWPFLRQHHKSQLDRLHPHVPTPLCVCDRERFVSTTS